MFGTVPNSEDSAVDNPYKILAFMEPTFMENCCKCPSERSWETFLDLQ